jgi:hypothetical protein
MDQGGKLARSDMFQDTVLRNFHYTPLNPLGPTAHRKMVRLKFLTTNLVSTHAPSSTALAFPHSFGLLHFCTLSSYTTGWSNRKLRRHRLIGIIAQNRICQTLKYLGPMYVSAKVVSIGLSRINTTSLVSSWVMWQPTKTLYTWISTPVIGCWAYQTKGRNK